MPRVWAFGSKQGTPGSVATPPGTLLLPLSIPPPTNTEVKDVEDSVVAGQRPMEGKGSGGCARKRAS